MVVPLDIVNWWFVAFERFHRLILFWRPQVDHVILWATGKKGPSRVPFNEVEVPLMASPDPKRLVLSDAPEIDVRVEGARSQLRRVLPVKIHDIVLLAKYLDLLVVLVHGLWQPNLDTLVAAGRSNQASVLVPLGDQNHAITVEDALNLALVAPDASQPIRGTRHHFVTNGLENRLEFITFQCTEVMSGSTPR
jgi:hypothetical protein